MGDFRNISKARLKSDGGKYVGPDMDWNPTFDRELILDDGADTFSLIVTTPDGVDWEICENNQGNLVIWTHGDARMPSTIFTSQGSEGSNVIELTVGHHDRRRLVGATPSDIERDCSDD